MYSQHTETGNAPLQHGGWLPFVEEEKIQLTGKIIGLSIPCSIIGYAIEMYRGVSPFPWGDCRVNCEVGSLSCQAFSRSFPQ